MFENADLIHAYTRADALNDGMLLDVSNAVRPFGILPHTAVTAGVWGQAIDIGADLAFSLRSFCAVLAANIRRNRSTQGSEFTYTMQVRGRPVEIRVVLGPGDRSEPVLTIMLSGES